MLLLRFLTIYLCIFVICFSFNAEADREELTFTQTSNFLISDIGNLYTDTDASILETGLSFGGKISYSPKDWITWYTGSFYSIPKEHFFENVSINNIKGDLSYNLSSFGIEVGAKFETGFEFRPVGVLSSGYIMHSCKEPYFTDKSGRQMESVGVTDKILHRVFVKIGAGLEYHFWDFFAVGFIPKAMFIFGDNFNVSYPVSFEISFAIFI